MLKRFILLLIAAAVPAVPLFAQKKKDQDPPRTEIVSGKSTYDADKNQVRFEGGVVLAQADFQLQCAQLIANMVAEARDSPIPQASGIRDAHAIGDVFIQRFMPDGSVKIGVAEKADYDTATGLIVLSNFPKIKDGQQVIEGTSASTRIFLTENGEHRVEGPSTVKFIAKGVTPDAFKLPDSDLLNLKKND